MPDLSVAIPDWLKPLSTADLNTLATQQANQILQSMLDPITRARALAQQNALAQREEILGLGGALAQIEAGMAPDIQSVFKGGANEMRSIGAGLGQSIVQGVQPGVDANAAYISKVAPGSTPTDAQPHASAEGAVVTGLLGTIPGDSFDAQGAAAGQYFAAQPGIEASRVREDFMANLAQARQADAEYVSQIVDIAKQFPQLRSQAFDALFEHEMDKLDARIKLQQLGISTQQQEFENQLSLRDMALKERAETAQEKALGLDVRKQNWQEQMDLAGIKLKYDQMAAEVNAATAKGQMPNVSLSALSGYIVDGYGNPILDKNGKRIPVVKTSSAASNSNSVYNKAVRQARTIRGNPIENQNMGPLAPGRYIAAPGAKGVYSGKAGMPATTNDPKKARYDTKLSFAEALQYLVEAYGISRAQARRALIAAGWRPDGKRPASPGLGAQAPYIP